MAFSRQAIRYRDGPWMPATLGLQGEYLLPLALWEPNEDLDFSSLDFQFDLIVAAEGEVDPNPCSMQQFEQEGHDHCVGDQGKADGERPLYYQRNFIPSTPCCMRCRTTSMPT